MLADRRPAVREQRGAKRGGAAMQLLWLTAATTLAHSKPSVRQRSGASAGSGTLCADRPRHRASSALSLILVQPCQDSGTQSACIMGYTATEEVSIGRVDRG